MKEIIPSLSRYLSDHGKIRSYFLFSFAEYQDEANIHFGALRVFNDDFIAAGAGFPSHPHKHYEIMTIMLQGTITHQDSLGNVERIGAGNIQVTYTGSGIFHSEINQGSEDILLYQLWFIPSEYSQNPKYYTANFSQRDFHNKLIILASGVDGDTSLVSQVRVKKGVFSKGEKLVIDILPYFFLYVTYGKIQLQDGSQLHDKDQLRVSAENSMSFEFLENSQILIVESL